MVVSTTSAWSQNVEDQIANIRNRFKLIEKAVKEDIYKKSIIEFDLPDFNSYGTITVYRENDEVRKIIYDELINDENSQIKTFFVFNNELFFVYHVSQAPYWIDAEKMELHYGEYRYYLNEEKPIRCLEKTFVIGAESNEPVEKLSQRTKNKAINCDNLYSIIAKYNEVLKMINQ